MKTVGISMDKKKYYRFGGLTLPLTFLFSGLLGGCSTTSEVSEPVSEPLFEPFSDSISSSTEVPLLAPKKRPQIKPDYPQRYTVVIGDTLWDISSHFLKDPWLWPEVWQKNPHVANPHLIFPGDVLVLHYIDGVPYIKVERPGAPIQTVKKKSYPTVKLSPKVRMTKVEQAITTISSAAISPFLIKPLVVSEKELDNSPYVVSSVDGHLIAGIENTLYIRNLGDEPKLRYTIVRKGKAYVNPNDDEDILGYEATYIAEGNITRKGDPASLKIKYAKREVLNGDRLLLDDASRPDHNYNPHAPERSISAQIISVVDGVSMIGRHQIVVLNLGRQDEVEAGHVLAVYRSGTIVRDGITSEEIELPEERSGLVMIFRVFDRVSYALVMDITVPLHVLDRVTNP
ncbi:MAG: LysM peptidoglycan-binding domain-containing protein [Gammaproteobacteria bacterium]|nr:LysM peptidoglycan-binding domain-containing protein [Gammaproteobacteria bacterium]